MTAFARQAGGGLAHARPPRAGARLALLLSALLASGALAAVPAGAASAAAPRCLPARANASALLPGTPLAVAPLPGTYVASPSTQISLLGAPPGAIAGVRVRGSRSGAHPGSLRAYSQGDGASFVPAKPFTAGETVAVAGSVAVAGRSVAFSYRFTVAYEDVLRRELRQHVHARDVNEKQQFRSAPLLQPPAIAVSARSPQSAPGYIFASPYGGPGASGPMIFDEAGSAVWFHPLRPGTEAANLQVQNVHGQPLLTWWQGYIAPQGFGLGEEVVADSSYRQINVVHAGNGYGADLHDFHITDQNTALMTAYAPVACDLSSDGGPRGGGAVTDSLVQEVDLGTGLVRREWHGLDHIALGDSYSNPRTASTYWPFDFLHVNSAEVPEGGRALVSARNTWALYELDWQSGLVLRRIGGRHSDVKLVPGAATAYQHDAERQPDGVVSVFDNGATPKVHSQSRGVLETLDDATGTVTFLAQYVHPTPLSAGSQGNLQLLANGDAFIGWGAAPYFSEFSAAGQMLFDAHMPGSYQSYRAYRFPWTGAPSTLPAVALGSPPSTVYASWNGDTRTASWRVLAGPAPQQLAPVAAAARGGFETAIALSTPQRYVAVQALDASGAVLATSAVAHG